MNRLMKKWSAVSTILAVAAATTPARAAGVLAGTVRDTSGAVVSGASVAARSASGAEARTNTGPDGRFAIALTPPVVLVVRAAGFGEAKRRVGPAGGGDAGAGDLDIVLAPATLLEAVTVTASRGVAATNEPAAVSVLTAAALESTAAPALDDQLKSIPGFSLFRRSSSRVANPTTQGVTMRGLSASGASRSLVLVDGVPLNDAFGGWIYWDRVPQAAIDRVEVVRGGASDLYGADAAGGVIQVLTAAPAAASLRVTVDVASRHTPRVSLFGGGARGAWNAFASGEWQRSDGYLIVAPEQRGPVDIAASARYRTAYGWAGYQASLWRAVVRAHAFREQRQNGTPLTPNDTSSRGVSAEVSGGRGRGVWQARAYGGTQDYNQGFSSVNAARTAESLTQLQTVPSASGGGSAQWTVWMGPTTWSAGGDARRVSGESDERTFSGGRQTGTTALGGAQWMAGGFARVESAVSPRLTLDASLSVGRWSTQPNQGGAADSTVAVNPKIAARWRAGDRASVHFAASRAFRAPTLNELFRNFRVGNALTSANAGLQPEVLTGAEGGIEVHLARADLRVVGFWNELKDAVTNVTLSSTPTLITRQRRNAGVIRAAGLEMEGEWQIAAPLRATAGMQLADSVFAAAQEPGLAGNRVPQVPRVHATAGLRVTPAGGWTGTIQLRHNSSQFDDDRNQFLLGRATVVDLFAAKSIRGGLQIFGAVENAFDDEYDVARTPTRTVGLPRTIRAGVRFAWK